MFAMTMGMDVLDSFTKAGNSAISSGIVNRAITLMNLGEADPVVMVRSIARIILNRTATGSPDAMRTLSYDEMALFTTVANDIFKSRESHSGDNKGAAANLLMKCHLCCFLIALDDIIQYDLEHGNKSSVQLVSWRCSNEVIAVQNNNVECESYKPTLSWIRDVFNAEESSVPPPAPLPGQERLVQNVLEAGYNLNVFLLMNTEYDATAALVTLVQTGLVL